MSELSSVSFVVIAYNEAANIARAIDSIAALEELDEYEIIVVDDGSCDGTTEIVERIALQNPRVRLIELGENHGRGHARSTGVAAARSRLIATVDADIVLPHDWLARARSALHGHDAVGGIAVPDGDVAYVHKRFGLIPRIVNHAATVTGSNGLYRREVFDAVSFDVALREGEDVALNHALDRRGLSSAVVSGLVVQHRENKAWGDSLRWMFDSGRGATRQLLVYHEIRQPDLAAGAFAGAAALGLFAAIHGHRLTGALLPAAVILAASVQHVRSRFETPWSDWSRVVATVTADAAMLTAYFAGRLVGLTALWRYRSETMMRWPRRDF